MAAKLNVVMRVKCLGSRRGCAITAHGSAAMRIAMRDEHSASCPNTARSSFPVDFRLSVRVDPVADLGDTGWSRGFVRVTALRLELISTILSRGCDEFNTLEARSRRALPSHAIWWLNMERNRAMWKTTAV